MVGLSIFDFIFPFSDFMKVIYDIDMELNELGKFVYIKWANIEF